MDPVLGAKQLSNYAQTLSHPEITRIYVFLDFISDLDGHRGQKTAIFPRKRSMDPLLGAKQFSKYAQTLSHPKSTRIYMFLDLILDLYGHRGRKTTIFPR